MACAEAACGWIERRRVEQAAGLTPGLVAELVQGVPEGKEHCPLLVAEALAALITARSDPA